MANNKIFQYELHDDGIAIITFDMVGESQNVLKPELATEITSILDELANNQTVKGIIIQSGKDNSFIAGADIGVLKAVKTLEQAEQISREGQVLFNKMEKFNVPLVSAIHGPCLGGGLEFAMACQGRVCSDSSSTKLGLPEVQIGLLPGSGGTQRLPRLIGIAPALDMMLTGKQLFAKQAYKLGLVDDVVPRANLLKSARKRVSDLIKNKAKKKTWGSLFSIKAIQKLALEGTPLGRNLLFDQAKKQLLKKTQGNYPAPEKILECVEKGINQGEDAGYAIEAKNFSELVMSSQAKSLISLFFATTELKKDRGIDSDVEPIELNKIGILGGGLMGSGIAYVSIDKAGKRVRLKDLDNKGIGKALNYSWNLISKKLKRRFISDSHAKATISRLTGTTDYSGFKDCQMVIEAVFEDMAVKHKMVKEVESNCSKNTIFATNTSSLPITEIAQVAKRPEQVVGLHYFSPVEKMPLVEIITTDKTADWVITSCVSLAKQQGKTPIVVNDGAGFYVNRILSPYMNEAGILLSEGVSIEAIDKALVKAGFPVGPIMLLDEVGIDVGTKVAAILEDAFGERMSPPKVFDKIIADDRKGKKNSKGFYQYNSQAKGKSKSKKEVDQSVYKVLGIEPSKELDSSEIVERGLLLMANEAARCLQDKIIRSPRDGDIGAIFGIGFPPYLGGPFRYMDNIGLDKVVERLKHYQDLYGERFAPADILLKKVKQKEGFHH